MGIKQDTFFDYEGFVDKFKPKKTTDDCYTPRNIYEVVRLWAMKEYNLEDRVCVRPFWPGRDYQRFDYPAGCVVIDNPPFSIISKIVAWYVANKIDFFLFAPYLTNFCIQRCNHIIAPCSVTYENGARVDTCFVTNLGEWFIRSAPDLMDAIQEQEDINARAKTKTIPKFIYPDCVITSANVGCMCKHRTPFALRREECAFIRRLDAQKSTSIFGGGYLLTERAAAERAAAERAAAERAAAERAAAHIWELSEREKQIQKMLSKQAEKARAGEKHDLC